MTAPDLLVLRSLLTRSGKEKCRCNYKGGRPLTSGSMAAARLALNDSLTKRFLPCNNSNPASILGTLLRFIASGYKRHPDKACFQMRLSFSPVAHFCLFLVQWADCNLAGALGLLRILIYMTYSDGKTTMFVHEKQASIKEFYGVIFPSLLQLQTGITEFEARKQKELCSSKYRRYGLHERREFTKLEKELEEECGICMEMNAKVVLSNCCHSLCFKCYQDWYSRSQSCPFCRDALKHVKSDDLWIYIDDKDIVEQQFS